MPHRNAGGRGGDIKGFAGDSLVHRHLLHRLQSISEEGLNLGFEHVGPLPHEGALIARELSHRTEHSGNAAFLAQQSHPQLLKGLSIRSIGNLCRSPLLERIQLISELLETDRGAQGTLAKGS